MPQIGQLGRRDWVVNQHQQWQAQRTQWQQQIQTPTSSPSTRQVRGYSAAALGDLGILAPGSLLKAAIILQDAAEKAADMARAQGHSALADAQLQVLRDAIPQMIQDMMAEAGDIPEGDQLYDEAIRRIAEKAASQP